MKSSDLRNLDEKQLREVSRTILMEYFESIFDYNISREIKFRTGIGMDQLSLHFRKKGDIKEIILQENFSQKTDIWSLYEKKRLFSSKKKKIKLFTDDDRILDLLIDNFQSITEKVNKEKISHKNKYERFIKNYEEGDF